MKKAFLLINGEPPVTFPDLTKYNLVCATDGGYKHLLKHQVKPDFISGDFDSLHDLPKDVEVIHTPDQNFTDFDKVLKILKEKGFTHIDVYGASGQEQDHFLGNLSTAIQWNNDINLMFYDNYGYYFLADKYTEIKKCKNKIVSLVPFFNVEGVTTKGLMYPLNNEALIFAKRIGTRNIAIKDSVEITYENGYLFVFVNDK
ncbi:thiamine diphosphokinase [Neotamlana laminarinivorans]|uniref:Thiamine diphosphokinase n=1 Tax=Neotamlana laminarinivorans TaxID=2883124 RepID=A0A9X1I1A0_9FLAO|nr:thiamine diphosphokinase [Tamlana laminarinivorans]MCB4799969.1 thiamine diphosphokinase [Tamlana laminarinivorans]